MQQQQSGGLIKRTLNCFSFSALSRQPWSLQFKVVALGSTAAWTISLGNQVFSCVCLMFMVNVLSGAQY